MSLAFERAFAITAGFEGGYSNHPNDRGGPTQFGITQATFNAWRRAKYQQTSPVSLLTMEEAKDIYFDRYWLEAKCDEMPMTLATCVFDAAVHHGPTRAIKFLQMVLDLPDDGRFGSMTRAALEEDLQTIGELDLVRQYLDIRAEFLEDLAEQPGQEVFGDGWRNRVDRLAAILVGTADA